MKESFDEVYNGPTRSGPIAVERVEARKSGQFMAKQVSKAGRPTHAHHWIFGDENAVCTKCGYTKSKWETLPARGL